MKIQIFNIKINVITNMASLNIGKSIIAHNKVSQVLQSPIQVTGAELPVTTTQTFTPTGFVGEVGAHFAGDVHGGVAHGGAGI